MATEPLTAETNGWPSLSPCPFCGATPHKGAGPAQIGQLHGERFQRARVWCPAGGGGFDGSHARIDSPSNEGAAGNWNSRR